MTVLRLRTTPLHASDISRTLELSPEHTLDDLHWAIQRAYELDGDHLYAFFLNNACWDREFGHGGPNTDFAHKAELASLRSLKLRRNRRFMYLFDFGDELTFEVRVLSTDAAVSVSSPRIVGSVGEAPPQYGHPYDEGSAPELPEPPPRLLELLRLVSPHVDAWQESQTGRTPSRHDLPHDVPWELECAQEMLDLCGDGMPMLEHAAVRSTDRSAWSWLVGLPRRLAEAGYHAEALDFSQRRQPILYHRLR